MLSNKGLPGLLLAALFLLCGPGRGMAQPVTQPFTFSLSEHDLPQVRHGAVAWSDYDGDGDLDVLMSGEAATGLITAVYRNDGKTTATDGAARVTFTRLASSFQLLVYSSAAWGDYDNDGDLDALILGSRTLQPPYEPLTILYRNDGNGFTLVADTPFDGFYSGTVAWGDYDNDGDPDLLLAGVTADGSRRTVLYRNGGGGTFAPVETGFAGVAFGDARWGDYDADGDLDLLLAGAADDGFTTRIYRNDGGGSFTDRNVNLDRLAFASVDWGDYDADGDLDLVLAGGRITPRVLEGATHLYRNDGGTFNDSGVTLAGVLSGAVTWGDYDADGDLDLLVIGAEQALGRRTARLYRNEGDGSFVNTTLLIGVVFGAADWGDYDGDGDLDLLASGFTSAGLSITNLYENLRQVRPPLPPAPAGLKAEVNDNTATLRWDVPVADPAIGRTYNLRVGTTPGGADIVSALADPATGRRYLARPGNAQQNTEWVLRDLPGGTYYWNVQALSPAFAASAFAETGTFHIMDQTSVATETAEGLPASFALYPNYPNPFNGTTTIRYDLPRASSVTLRVFNVLGAVVATLVDGVENAGTHAVGWDGRNVSGGRVGSGLYFYELRAGDGTYTGKMTLLR